jgi:hypothetical protein
MNAVRARLRVIVAYGGRHWFVLHHLPLQTAVRSTSNSIRNSSLDSTPDLDGSRNSFADDDIIFLLSDSEPEVSRVSDRDLTTQDSEGIGMTNNT